tara:strand:+ start:212 stop:616 length:405 start_codon:yes stop_codon:yes gene_type:complete
MPENKENNKDQQVEAQQTEPVVEKNLQNLSQTHGKTEEFKPTTLDQIWGDTGTWKYQTMDESEYGGMLENMPKSDLLAHAQKVGLIPIDDRTQLTKRLILEFRRHVSTYRMSNSNQATSKPLSKEAEKILKEGR